MNKYMKAMNAELSDEELCSIKRSEIPKGGITITKKYAPFCCENSKEK